MSSYFDGGETDVIIIGGGATGAGIARDCARRGLRCILLERHDIATGATGRNHGLLHSGARYAVTDGESARECIEENRILKRIAHHCIERTDGLFITLPQDSLDYQQQFIAACRRRHRRRSDRPAAGAAHGAGGQPGADRRGAGAGRHRRSLPADRRQHAGCA